MFKFYISNPDEKGLVKVKGVNFETDAFWHYSPFKLDKISAGTYIVLKLAGGSVWSARWEQRYQAARFMVVKVLEINKLDNDFVWYKVEDILEFPVRKEKKNAG